MITKRELARWEAQEKEVMPEILAALREVHTPLTSQAKGFLVAGMDDGVIVHIKDRDGDKKQIQLNAYLALLLAKDLIDAGRNMGWIDEDGNIKTDPRT